MPTSAVGLPGLALVPPFPALQPAHAAALVCSKHTPEGQQVAALLAPGRAEPVVWAGEEGGLRCALAGDLGR